MRKKRMDKHKGIAKTIVKILVVVLIITLGVFIAYKHTQKDVGKTEIVQASIGEEQNNGDPDSEEEINNNPYKDNNSKVEDNNAENDAIEMNENDFDAGKIQDFLTKNIKVEDGKKIAYLTFDDGPSTTVTPKILNILKNNNIKATFFIVGSQLEESPEAKNILLDIYNQGHSIGNHTYTHNYSKLYPNGKVDTDTFMAELEETNNEIKSVLGGKFKTRIIRFPGGHFSWSGTEDIDKKLEEKKYKYIDWNALTGDAEGGHKTKEQILNRYHQVFVGQEKVVLLMHDTYGKESTADALQDIITDLKNKGYDFKALK